jgi:hypothetical protein
MIKSYFVWRKTYVAYNNVEKLYFTSMKYSIFSRVSRYTTDRGIRVYKHKITWQIMVSK